MLDELIGLRRSRQLTDDGPFRVCDDDAAFLADEGYSDAVRRIAGGLRFPFALTELIPALRKGERLVMAAPEARPRNGSGPYGRSLMFMAQALLLAKRMAMTNRIYCRMAFDLTDAEMDALVDAHDLGLMEAANYVRAEFRSGHYRDVMLKYATFRNQPSKDKHGILSLAARIVGLGTARRPREALR
ncbi:hypothetical protein [Rhodanobacter denitrificans]|uniref:hypothetical protein n=1 Tax=Rhodanobacter denitrificans TaxID=666685 RepID=UPI0009179C36|nr:hypothetical protein [Rhodanobacter denitrificans]UJJ52925.1 hypothetical protein LRK52_18650 [Rhodanobacter denitrificans]